jgi:hypothetical protein
LVTIIYSNLINATTSPTIAMVMPIIHLIIPTLDSGMVDESLSIEDNSWCFLITLDSGMVDESLVSSLEISSLGCQPVFFLKV